MRTQEQPSLSFGWIFAATLAVIVALCLSAGCRSVDDAVLASLDGQLKAWRLVRAEGPNWEPPMWDGRLASYAAECRVLRARLDGTLQPADSFTFKQQELTRGQ